jgi:hypothetical protein
MKSIERIRPTADVAGAEYLAKAMAKWPDAIQQREPGQLAPGDRGEVIMKKGGEAIIVPAERMPTSVGAAAVYRF